MDRRRDDGLRLSLFRRPRRAGAPPLAIALCAAQRLPQAPLPGAPLHHAVEGKERCVSFGFLYAPPLPTLKRQLRELHDGPLRKAEATADAPTERSDAA